MKKIISVLALLAFLQEAASACDICGCGVGSYYIGILPDFRKRFLGFRYQNKSMLTHLNTDGTRSYLTNEERYRSWELWSGWNIGSRFRVLAFVPLNSNERSNGGLVNTKSGLGDIAVVGYYNLIRGERTTDSTNKRVVQSLWIGGGAKLPTGRYDPLDKTTSAGSQNTFQLGTASVDFTLNAMYDVRVQDLGLNLNGSYKINTANSYGYQYGNKMTLNALAYYKIRAAKNCTIAPNAGVLYEHAEKDFRNAKSIVEESGGHTLMGTVGTELAFNRFGLGVNYQAPLSQSLAFGMVRAQGRLMLNLTVAL